MKPWRACTGELPLEIIRMKANGIHVALTGNKGFTLPSDIGEIGDDITKLDLSSCSLTGLLSTRTERLRMFADLFLPLYPGKLPEELGKLVNLTYFDASFNDLTGGLSTRTERFSFLVGCFCRPLSKLCRVRPRPERVRELDQPGELKSVRKPAASAGRRTDGLRWRHDHLRQSQESCGFSSVLEINSR